MNEAAMLKEFSHAISSFLRLNFFLMFTLKIKNIFICIIAEMCKRAICAILHAETFYEVLFPIADEGIMK